MRQAMTCVTVKTSRSLVSQWLMLLFIALLSFSPLAVYAEDNVSVTLLDGTANNAPMPETRIDIRELQADGTTVWYKRVTTDASGQASTVLEGIDTGKQYQLSARSTFNNRSKKLIVNTTGSHTFQVGTPLLNVTLINYQTKAVFANTRVYAYQVNDDGSLQYLSREDSDESGQLTLDLPVLSTGGKVQLKANKPLNNIDAYSALITEAGNIDFEVGKLQLSVLNGDTEAALANQDISIYTQQNGVNKWYGKATTNDNGQLQLSLKGLYDNAVTPLSYVFKTRSPFNNQYKESQVINTLGEHQFLVGAPLLHVTLTNQKTQTAIANKRVTAYQVLEDQSRKYLDRATTDTNGQLSLDLPTLSDGGSVQLVATKPTSNIDAYSQIITKAGEVSFKVGALEIEVLDSDTDKVIADQDIYIYTQSNGTNKWYGRAKTNDAGLLQLNLKDLYESVTTAQTYIFKTRSPFNNKYKESQAINTLGEHKFLVGTPLLHVTLSNQKTQTAIANTRVTAYQVLEDRSRKYLGRATTDTNGQLSLDLPILSNGGSVQLVATKPTSNINAYSGIITSAGEVDFKVGQLQIQVQDNDTQEAITDQDVYIYSQQADGTSKWYGKSKTDADGLLQLNLKGLNSGTEEAQSYTLKTRSPFNRQYKESQIIDSNGEYVFSVGEPLLHVTLKDASNGNALITNTEIRAYQVVNGEVKGLARATTNEEGVASFDIPALSEEGTTVQLWTKVFNSNFWAKSQDITTAGNVDFLLGATRVKVIDGSVANGEAIADLKVYIREVIDDETTKYIGHAKTDSEGLLRLTLPELAKGKSYKFDANNPSSLVRQRKYSQAISTTGDHTFVLGTQLLQVTLKNAFSGQPLANNKIYVYQNTDEEGPQWRGGITTDGNGQAALDLPQLAEAGNSFYLRARKPYGVSDVISDTFGTGSYTVDFPVGKTPVTLTDKNTGSAIENIKIHSFEVLSTGSLASRSWAITDASGIAHFDLPSLAAGNRHIFRANNPFANGKNHYSEIVTAEGPVNFAIGEDETNSLDLVAPSLAITSPTDGSEVGSLGFTLTGTASDNKQLSAVTVSVNGNDYPASIDTATSTWQLAIPAAQLTTGTDIQLTVTATDDTKNQTVIQASYQVIADAAAPTINISSPSDNGSVPKTGFLATGTVTDDTGISTLHAKLEDSSLGLVIDREIEVSAGGNWALAVNNGQLTESGTATLTLVATDIAEHQSTIEVTVSITAAEHELRHMINRITFGANDALINEVRSIGVSEFLEQQLAPDTIDDSALETKLADIGTPTSISDLQLYQLNHMIYSKRQLREVMAWFWENHFNTFIKKSGNTVAYELAEHDAFRANALGNFRTLLEISAKSPAMLVYLDNILNVSDDANENYAREVMELTTCGVDACYTETDVEELAEILTGWQVKDDAFFFNDDEHTKGPKLFQGVTIEEAGVAEGNLAFDMLATHEATANYICSKLINVFIRDDKLSSLNERCATTFQETADDDDQISQVVRSLLTSPEFNDPINFNSKVKTPVEFAVGVTRALDAQGTHADLPGYSSRMGISLFWNPVPTGWSELGSTWISSNTLLERTRFVNQVAAASIGSLTYIEPVTYFKDKNIETPEGITTYLFDLLGGDIWSDLEREIALEILNDGDAFDIDAESADSKLRELIGTIQSYPEYHYQ